MNTNTEFKIHRQNGYTIMPNKLLRDMNLSLKSKALLSLMLSLPEDWDYSVAGLTAIVKEGYDSVNSAIRELIKYNYVFREESRKERGLYKYIYHIFECPEDNYFKDFFLTGGEKRVPVKRLSDKQQQQNKEYKIDKIDKTIEHNILTKELINLGYIDSNDFSSFYFDILFQKYLSEGRSYTELFSAIHYIVPRVISNEFKDEDGYEINNKYGYFKTALESNFRKFEEMADEIWSEAELTNILEDYKMNKKEEGELNR